jgi:predicted metal-dependent enzyme (double-stranded beta helix superfamily)
VVQRRAASPAEWLTRVRLNPSGRWYERIHLDDSHEVWVISWLPGQATGFHDHGGSAGAFTVVWGTLAERRMA